MTRSLKEIVRDLHEISNTYDSNRPSGYPEGTVQRIEDIANELTTYAAGLGQRKEDIVEKYAREFIMQLVNKERTLEEISGARMTYIVEIKNFEDIKKRRDE